MTAAATWAPTVPAARGAEYPRLLAQVDPRLVRDAARLLIAAVLALVLLAAIVASATYLAGPVPAVGPAPGLSL